MRKPLNGSCPNCQSQVVLYDWGFKCSVCEYDHKQWAAFLTAGHEPLEYIAAALAKFPLHEDSPALISEEENLEARR